MKPIFKFVVADPEHVSESENLLSESVCQLISKRHSESQLSKSANVFLVYLYINRAIVPSSFECVADKIYLRDYLTQESYLERISFCTTLKAGLKVRVQVPADINNVFILLSNVELAENEVFPSPSLTGDNEGKRAFHAVDPIYDLEDVIMNDEERETLYQALAIVQYKDLVFNKWNFRSTDKSTKSVLCFHGVPGTGKTMCAHGVAKFLGKKIIFGNYNEIQSKYVGEGVKNLKACFDSAEEQDAVLFIDEADTFLSKRLPSSNENSKIYNSMSNELFQFVENFNGCLIFASNHITDFDPAIISRIIQPIEFRLPDEKARISIIKKLLPNEVPLVLTEENLKSLSAISEGFSGRDIRKSILLLLASAAYKYKVQLNIPDDDIRISFDDICSAFRNVKKEKDRLQKRIGGENALVKKALDEQRKNERLLNCAANAVWADGEVQLEERDLFKELCNKFGVTINLMDRTSIMPIEDICGKATSKAERIQLLDISARMVAVDGEYTDTEQNFIHDVAGLLGLAQEEFTHLDSYISALIKNENDWKLITKMFLPTDIDILHELKTEYTEGAAYYHLSEMYGSGSEKYGGILPNEKKMEQYLRKAKDLGYAGEKNNQK